ncbi:hypothetical protein JRQ81_010900 [Phrynocephalus forsythii]|uniref:Roundabout homolog 4 n=1 Tax=Phrynocephalus forsythii TaxID=171643 RepID=A0A9Q0X7C1_9SAUR|nr:hypothetical protein JRQ81_010900 [Phrynocephalus forsythii]
MEAPAASLCWPASHSPSPAWLGSLSGSSGDGTPTGSKSCSEEFVPQIIDHPSDLVVRWDQPATLNCRATGNPAPTIEWYRNGEYVKTNKDDATSQPTLLMDGSLFFLRLSQKKGKSDEGVYNCVARNHFGTAVSKNASLYVEALQEEFRLQPSDLVVTTGERLSLECMPPRGHPEPTISWKKNGVLIHEESGHYEVVSGKLLIPHVLKSDSGAYVCMATNQVGERASRTAVVTVLEKPTFTWRPNDVSAKLGSAVQFLCGVHGDPTPIVQWHKENGELPTGRYEVNQENVLQINDLTMYDAGKYVCMASNKAGTIVAKATLKVQDLLDTGQKEWDESGDVLKELMDIRIYLLNVTALPSAPAAHLHWKVIPIAQSQHIEGYKVFYRSLLPVSSPWAEWDVHRNHHAIVPALERGYMYEFKVRPYLGKIHGLDSNTRHLWIPEEVPSAAPQRISIATIPGGNGTAVIHWEPPPHDARNGIIKAYQIWFLGNETHHGSNKTVDGGIHSFEMTGLASGLKYCVQIAAVNGAGIGEISHPVCSTVEPTVEKMAKTSGFLSSNDILGVVRQPVFIASMGSALWIMLMVLAVYVCQQQARQNAGRQYILGEGLYRNASDDTIIKHRVDSSDSPWLSNTWKSTSGSKNYSTTSSLSSQMLWTEHKENQDCPKSTVSLERQSQGSCIQTLPLVPDGGSSSLYGSSYVDLPGKDLKTFYGVPLPPPSNSSLQTLELAPTCGQRLLPHCSRKPRMESTAVKEGTQQGPWKTASLLPSSLIIQGSWDKNSKKELQQVHSTPMPPPSFSAEWVPQGSRTSGHSSGKQHGFHGEMRKLLKTYSSPKFSQYSTSQKFIGLLPPPPPAPPGFQADQEHNTQLECTCTCYLEPHMEFTSCQQDKDSRKAASDSMEKGLTFPTLPYSRLSAASISISLTDDRETVLTPEEVAEYLELSDEAECQRQQNDNISATPQMSSLPHTYGYICGPLASELLENGAMEDDDDPNMVETGGHSARFFRSFCRTPTSSLSEDEASLGGSLLNGWGSVSEDNGTSTRCSLVSSSDASFLVDANFAQALAVAVDSFLPSASLPEGLPSPAPSVENAEEMQQKPTWQALPVWEWNSDWVDEMEARYMHQVEDQRAAPKMRKGKAAVVGETCLLPASTSQEINGASGSDSIIHPDATTGAIQTPLICAQEPMSRTLAIPNEGKDRVVEKFKGRESIP